MNGMLRSLSIFFMALLMLIAASGYADTVDVISNTYFFSSPTPLNFAQAGGDEWGVSPDLTLDSKRPEGYKSKSRAMLLSLLLPGLGEIYVGDSRTRAASFLTAELGIWSTFVLHRRLGKWRKDDFIGYAIVNARVDPTGKDDAFWDMVGFHASRDEYNGFSRVYTPTNPFYPETATWDWQWQDDVERKKYRDLKNDSKSYYRIARFALTAAALNRVVSAFFAWRSAGGHNRQLYDEFSNLKFEVGPYGLGDSPEIRLSFNRSF